MEIDGIVDKANKIIKLRCYYTEESIKELDDEKLEEQTKLLSNELIRRYNNTIKVLTEKLQEESKGATP